MVPYDVPVCVHLPGGWLKITIDKDLKFAMMEGPATYVYSGDYAKE
jgi:diaminopimelate epimerase